MLTKTNLINIILALVIFILYQQGANGMIYYRPGNICNIELIEKPRNCSNGFYFIRGISAYCPDRQMCYRGVGEACKDIEETRCARGLSCMCGRCVNCLNGICPELELCQRTNQRQMDALKRWSSPFVKRVQHLYHQGTNEYY